MGCWDGEVAGSQQVWGSLRQRAQGVLLWGQGVPVSSVCVRVCVCMHACVCAQVHVFVYAYACVCVHATVCPRSWCGAAAAGAVCPHASN